MAARPYVGAYFPYALSAACLLLFLWMVFKVVTTPSRLPVTGVPRLGELPLSGIKFTRLRDREPPRHRARQPALRRRGGAYVERRP